MRVSEHTPYQSHVFLGVPRGPILSSPHMELRQVRFQAFLLRIQVQGSV